MSKKNLAKIRLSVTEVQGIVKAIKEVLTEREIPLKGILLYLDGSRTKMNRKGGDIDVVLEIPENLFKTCREFEIKFLVAIYARIGEQKIDLLIRSKKAPLTEFESVAFKNRILLKKW